MKRFRGGSAAPTKPPTEKEDYQRWLNERALSALHTKESNNNKINLEKKQCNIIC
jgi:hypothetical protein